MEQEMTGMENTLTRKYAVSSYEVNSTGKARLTSIANYLQETAYHHARHLGLGYRHLAERNMAWVLSRMRIRMIRYPSWDDLLTIETWPRGIEKLFALRDFRISEKNGDPVAEAATCWLMVDTDSLRPQRIIPDFIPVKTRTDGVFEHTPGKIELPGDMVDRDVHRVVYSDLDVVGHVNNVKYIEWITDLLGPGMLEEKGIEDITINYMAEAKAGDEVELLTSGKNHDSTYVSGRNLGTGRECFRAALSFCHH